MYKIRKWETLRRVNTNGQHICLYHPQDPQENDECAAFPTHIWDIFHSIEITKTKTSTHMCACDGKQKKINGLNIQIVINYKVDSGDCNFTHTTQKSLKNKLESIPLKAFKSRFIKKCAFEAQINMKNYVYSL